MKSNKGQRLLIFDGSDDSILRVSYSVVVDGFDFNFNPAYFKPVSEIALRFPSVDLDLLINDIGCKITSFDGKLIYHGCKPGLRLYYCVRKVLDEEVVVVFSLGESQPGRFLCYFECIVHP